MANKLCKQIDLGIDPMTGKRIRKRIYYTSKTDLERQKKDLIREYVKHGNPSNMTFGEYRMKWFEANYAHLYPSTKMSYLSSFNHSAVLDHMKLKNITRQDLLNIINTVWDTPHTACRLATMMQSMFDSAVFDGIVDKNIAYKLKKPSKPKSDTRALTLDELQAVKDTQFDEQEQLLVNILRQFGLRPGEALALMPSDFNRKARTLTISKAVAYNKETPFIKPTKTTVTRVLPVPDEFFSLLPQEKCLYYFNHNGQLLTKKRKETLCRHILEKINATMGGNKKLKVFDATLYIFRHTKATDLYYLQGISMKMKAAYMGHSEEMFLKTYSHLCEERENTELLRTMAV